MKNEKLIAVSISALLLTACGGGGGGGSSERQRVEAEGSMADRVIFEQRQQAGTYESSNISTINIPVLSEGIGEFTDFSCDTKEGPDEQYIRESFTRRSSGEICASSFDLVLCYGQRSQALYIAGEDDSLNLRNLILTSDEMGSVADFALSYNQIGDPTIEFTSVSAGARNETCIEDEIVDTLSPEDILGDWKFRMYRVSSDALPLLERSGSMSCGATECLAPGIFDFGEFIANEGEEGVAYEGPMLYEGVTYGTTRAVLSTSLTTMALMACPDETSARRIASQCRFLIGERK